MGDMPGWMRSAPRVALESIVVDRTDPMGVAAVWQRAADTVRALARPDLPADDSWNAAIDRAAALLTKEAEDVRLMNEMAYRLTVGNLR